MPAPCAKAGACRFDRSAGLRCIRGIRKVRLRSHPERAHLLCNRIKARRIARNQRERSAFPRKRERYCAANPA